MPKQKTKSFMKKRLKITGSGNYKRSDYGQHLMSSKSKKAKRKRTGVIVPKFVKKMVRKSLGGKNLKKI